MHTYNHRNSDINSNLFNTDNEDLNEVLRGEISAVEAYTQVMEKIESAPESYRLRQFKLDHENAVKFWKKQAKIMGKIPSNSSSIWGKVVESFVGISKIVGEEQALKALKKGEEHGLSLYEDLLKSEQLTSFQKDEIKNSFIPRQKRHIESINAITKIES